jgi:hypothetical protein
MTMQNLPTDSSGVSAGAIRSPSGAMGVVRCHGASKVTAVGYLVSHHHRDIASTATAAFQ